MADEYLARIRELVKVADREDGSVSEPERRAFRAQATQLAVLSIAESLATVVGFIEDERAKEEGV